MMSNLIPNMTKSSKTPVRIHQCPPSIMIYGGYLWYQIGYQIWPNPPKLQLGSINILQVWLCSWCTYNHAGELKIRIQLWNGKLCLFMMSNLIPNMTKSSKNAVRNNQCPPSVTVFLMFNHVKELKIWIQLRNDKLC